MQLIIRLRREKDSNKCQSCSFGAESVANGVDEANGGDVANEHGDVGGQGMREWQKKISGQICKKQERADFCVDRGVSNKC